MKQIYVELEWKLVENTIATQDKNGIYLFTPKGGHEPSYVGTCKKEFAEKKSKSAIYYASVKEHPQVPYPDLLKYVEEKLQYAVQSLHTYPVESSYWGPSENNPVKVTISSAYPGWILNNAKELNQLMESPFKATAQTYKKSA